MTRFVHQRHQAPTPLERSRPLVIVCAPMRSNVNLSRIVRAAGCCGVERVIACGTARLIHKIARDADEADEEHNVVVEPHRTLSPVLRRLRSDGLRLVGLEQATDSHCLYDYPFPRRTALVIGNERLGLEPDALELLDDVVEIPIYGRPLAHNAATAAAIAMYEYCRQYPAG